MAAAKGNADKRRKSVRLVPIHDSFYNELHDWYLADDKKGPLIHYHGRAIKSMKTAWKNTLKSAKITRRIRPYDVRHFFVTQALEKGADIKALAQVVGSSPKTIMKHYQHVTQEVHRMTVATIPDLPEPIPDRIPSRKKRQPVKKKT